MAGLQLSVLNEAEIERLHCRTLDLFEDPGVVIGSEAILKKLASAGARVDGASGRVRFPREMVEELLRQAPPVACMTSLRVTVLEAGGANRY